MSFISPWFLFGLLGIGIPLLIHLIRREKAAKLAFSTIRFLKKVPKKMTLFQEFQQWLLLLVRIAIIALLAIAFARPFLTAAFSNLAGIAPRSTIILVDTSMSMGYSDYFDRAKQATLHVLESLQSGDEAAIITFSEGTDSIIELTTNMADLKSFMRNLDSPGYQSTNYFPALRLADQLLQSAINQDKTVYLISDYQRRAFDDFDTTWRLSPGVAFKGIKIEDEKSINLAVTEVKSPHQLVQDQEEHTILGRVRNTGTLPLSEARVSLRIDERTVETKTVDLSETSEAVVGFNTVFRQRDMHLGSISVEDDKFLSDNSFYFTVDIWPAVKILCVNGESSVDWHEDESYWFRLAMGSQGESPFQVDVVQPSQVTPAELDKYQVIVLLNVGELDPSRIKPLKSYVEGGGSLLIAPSDRVDAQTFNNLFAGLSPALLERKYPNMGDNYLVLAEMDERHPIIHPLKTSERDDFGTARFRGYWATKPVDGSEIIMRFDNGADALLELALGKGRVLMFTSSLDTEWNNLPLQVFYLPLMHETINYLALMEDKKQAYNVGESVPIVVPQGKTALITGPSHQETKLVSTPEDYSYYKSTHIPGFYNVRTGNIENYFAVNYIAKESDLSSIPISEIRDTVMNPITQPQEFKEVQLSMIKSQLEKSQHIWWWLLFLVLLMGLGETLLANRTYR